MIIGIAISVAGPLRVQASHNSFADYLDNYLFYLGDY